MGFKELTNPSWAVSILLTAYYFSNRQFIDPRVSYTKFSSWQLLRSSCVAKYKQFCRGKLTKSYYIGKTDSEEKKEGWYLMLINLSMPDPTTKENQKLVSYL